jgi:hypothetical protein
MQTLRSFAGVCGRNWKSAMREFWEREAFQPNLQNLKQTHGFEWLKSFKLPKE